MYASMEGPAPAELRRYDESQQRIARLRAERLHRAKAPPPGPRKEEEEEEPRPREAEVPAAARQLGWHGFLRVRRPPSFLRSGYGGSRAFSIGARRPPIFFDRGTASPEFFTSVRRHPVFFP